jgi:phage/conjugal plasmid C-4 type zinc finger TraR family protein
MADVCDQADVAIQEQLDRSLAALPKYSGVSAEFCEECDSEIPEKRRMAIPGAQLCVGCQANIELKGKTFRR